MAIEYVKSDEPKNSAVERKDSPCSSRVGHHHHEGEGTQALPVDPFDKPKMGRPRTGYIKGEYNRLYSSDKRAADKLGISVKEFRSQKGQGK